MFDKPSGLLSVRGKAPEHQDSLQYRAETVWPAIGVVHRLDMATSGIMIMALSKLALSELGKQFQHRQIYKKYIATVWGHPKSSEGKIELPLKVDWPNRPKQQVCFATGKPSETLWRCLSRDIDPAGNLISRIELTPITGRSHQLRVHLAQIGLPILGDKFYAHDEAFAAAPRLLLHAQSLTLRHPSNGELLRLKSACPF
ncbi:MAG: pseudouridine synthase [Kangiellaceae bacterium]|nr:pseudouridine synthase [Kangiellaceae bacterium]MCW8997251.1 pseudouridine synthase [Kangiellaceae bacterium]